jgi:hypothetical protein
VLQRPIETTRVIGMWLLTCIGPKFPHSENPVSQDLALQWAKLLRGTNYTLLMMR